MYTAEEEDDETFCSALSQVQRQFLKLLYHQPPDWYAKLEQLAEQEGELMEVLLDRINLLFFQYYDDFCLDLRKQPPELYAEYRDEIRDACPFLLITDETESEI